ncbi:MAG: phosphoethanolamine--lipid A transferase [Bdellovibrionales bacterium]|nr:phosphoethanolamine--lipid A transferase [Ramlibacter sp.]
MSLKLFRTTEFSTSSLFTRTRPTVAVHPIRLVLLCALWLAVMGNLPLWQALYNLPETANARGLFFGVMFCLAIAGANAALLGLLAWRGLLKPAIVLLVMVAALSTHYMLVYRVVIDRTMLVNVFNTDIREVRDLISWRLAGTMLVLGLLPAIWFWRKPVRRVGWLGQAIVNLLTVLTGLAVAVVAVLPVFQDFSSTMRNNPQLRYLINPLNTVWAGGSIITNTGRRASKEVLPIGEDARLGSSYAAQGKPPLLLLVVGETARAGNFALNGYARPTSPKLAAENLVSFRNAWSCGTNTAASVPCMFSHLGKEGYESRQSNYENLVDVLQRAGLAVLWVDNQSGCSGPCERIPNVNTSREKNAAFCSAGECHDEVMLSGLNERIAALPAERRARGVVVVMHQMGSHGPAYYKRVPAAFKTFRPECASSALQDCAREQVVNAYDNTIVYTDHFLAAAISWLKTQTQQSAPAMMYVADHGESLGENNLYLHGLPYSIAPDVQKRVPWITWLSPAFEQRSRLTTACLKERLDDKLSHDNYFHSVLGLMDVQTALYQPALNMFAACASRN